jgi:hypothetical protein
MPIRRRLLGAVFQVALVAGGLFWRLDRLGRLGLAATFLFTGAGLRGSRRRLMGGCYSGAGAHNLSSGGEQGNENGQESVQMSTHDK